MSDDRDFTGSGIGSDALDAGWDDLEPIGESLDDDGIREARDPKERRARAAAATGRAVSGLVGLGAAVVLIGGLSILQPLPSFAPEAQGVVVQPQGLPESRICVGSPLLLADDADEERLVLRALGTPQTAEDAEDSMSSAALQSDGVLGTPTAPRVHTIPAEGDPDRLIAASQLSSLDGPVRGLDATACTDAAHESWLVGGSTETGRTSLIILSNASSLDASVTLTVYGAEGQIGQSSPLVVAGGSQRVVSLASYAQQEASPVVHVLSSGAPVSAQLQQTVVRTLDSGGIDTLGAVLTPSRTQVIPSLPVTTAAGVEALFASPGFEDLRTIVRIFVPGSGEAEVLVRAEGATAGFTAEVPLEVPRGEVVDVALDALPDDRYTVTVTGDQPLLASARVSAVAEDGSDLLWAAAAAPLDERAMAVVLPGASASLTLASVLDVPVTVTLDGPDGSRTVTVPAGEGLTVPIAAGTTVLEGVRGLSGSIGYQRSGGLASVPLLPLRVAPAEVTVYP